MLIAVCLCTLPGGCVQRQPDSSALVESLRTYPEVAEVIITSPKATPKATLIHLLNWHYIPPEAFSADLRTADPSLTDAEYERFLGDVEAIQEAQMAILRRLIKDHGLRYIYLEGLTDANRDRFLASIEQMRAFEQNLPSGETGIELLLLDEHRHQTLLVGAAGRLLLAGEPIEIHAAEEEEAYAAANPVVDGAIRLDAQAQAERETRMVERIKAGGHPLAVLICGGAHDLSEPFAKTGIEYLRVSTRKYAKATE